ncbi:hypothetical protein FANTH_768 [Fusarium anthophilum]|uniref:Uncharacterized protein n=1 Tax=Fusarium anthophilum TaxID=48485 RepID=A0A8H5EBT5_9HYPO|nr:hypothetical protein FANTH_768 [Fusarium anthophilum]
MKYSTISLISATILGVFARFKAIDIRSVAQVHPTPPTTLASSRGLHQDRFALEGSTLLTCPAPVSTTCTSWTRGINSYTDEDGKMDKAMIYGEISGIISKISKSVKLPFPGSGILLAIFAIMTICKTRLKNCFNFFVKQTETAMNNALEHVKPTKQVTKSSPRFAIMLAFSTLHGAIDVRSTTQQDSMSSTSLAPNVEVPSEMGTLTIDSSLELETLFSFIDQSS